jgi:hypothetical protein
MVKNYCEICHQFEGCQYPLWPSSIPQRRTSRCSACKREVLLVNLSTACECLGMDPKTLWRWRNRGLVTSVRHDGRRPLIYWSSLFNPDTPVSPAATHLRAPSGIHNIDIIPQGEVALGH